VDYNTKTTKLFLNLVKTAGGTKANQKILIFPKRRKNDQNRIFKRYYDEINRFGLKIRNLKILKFLEFCFCLGPHFGILGR
jgi:hypothetical protein